MSRPDQVKLISESYVRPEFEVDESKRQYKLGPSDLSMLLLEYSKCVILFNKPQTFNPSSFLVKLRLSISRVLVHFYPLAGQLVTHTYKDEHSCSVCVDCHKGPGAKLIHAEAFDLSIDDVLSSNSDIPQVVQSFFDVGEMTLINYDGHTKPLLSVQVTELADGVALGVSTNHCLVDGISCHHFFKIWSEIFMASSSSLSSSNNMSVVVVDGSGPMIKLPYLQLDELIIRGHHSHTRDKIFHFSLTSKALLKAKANAEASESTISSFQALAAFVWRCITRARDLCSNERTTCAMAADLRPRFVPPLPQEYFGNCLTLAKVTAEAGELLANTLGWAASLLHNAVVGLNDQASQGLPQLLMPGMRSHGMYPVAFGGSPRFDLYALDFGLGRAVAVHMGFQNRNGKVAVFPGAKGDGSVDLHVCLAPKVMSKLLADLEFMSFASNSNFLTTYIATSLQQSNVMID